ncbi:hypothetical protein BW716_28425 [[Flexibacter] sp. ATCC 35208]|nr:hypothetical protein BW716_28425 [[Flexibacter] sp. ATCC 35208]
MYQTILVLHSINRYLVLISLVYCIIMAWNGVRGNKVFSSTDNTFRHLTATIAHIQLMLGLYLYIISPVIRYNVFEEYTFFRYLHIALMVIAIIIITIGSAKAKRMETDKLKFMTILLWFSLALLIILIAIPWPFSPLAHRPYFRSF